ncbi:MAG: enoyl-CoA hydratase/isomerase family protein [Spirochaetes bacterium]|nr:enoyl-CoA hydratase/isomerase family protein [Spirochaetota bacterium]
MAKVFNLEKQDDLAIVRFDVAGDAVNTWTDQAVEDFDELIGRLEKEKSNYKAVIFISGKSSFHAGGDLALIESITDYPKFQARCMRFTQLFLKMENLGIPTIAAINGQCMGGGYEFALAMTARIATDSPKTLVGLPEISVGLMPGGGGTQRLPRLIGYAALEIILKGQVMPAKKGLEAGLIDKIVPESADLLAEAKVFAKDVAGGTAALKRPKQDLSGLDEVIATAAKGVLKASRGRELPGPKYALKAIKEGLKMPIADGLALEVQCFMNVLRSPEAKGMINTFFLKTYSDKPQAMIPKGFAVKQINKLAVLGFGIMGRGIVIEILRRLQKPVVVKDLPAALEPGKAAVKKVLEGMAEKGKLAKPVDDLMKLIIPVTDWTDDFKDVDVVIEAVFEDPAVKDEVYRSLCTVVPDNCILASNTSSLPVNLLAQSVKNPQRFAGIHFFSPVWKMELVEIIRGKDTSDDAINNIIALAAALRKRPVVCNDNPGFVVNAMLFPYFIKTYELLGEGVSIESIDNAMMKFGLPVGPIRLTDEVGIDTSYLVLTKSLKKTAPPAIENLYKAGRYGRNKNGKGFYDKEGKVDVEALPLINPDGKKKEYSEEQIQEMLFTPFIATGNELLEKKIINDPRSIDIGAVWGIGFPADKGGPMKWADLTGLSKTMFNKNFYK